LKKYIQKDIIRAKALYKMALISYQRLQEMSFFAYPSNTLADAYTIIHKYIDAFFAIQGITFRGENAQKELLFSARESHINTRNGWNLLDQMRQIRNQIQYEGYFLDAEYMTRNEKQMKMVMRELQKKVEKKIASL
jgi:hypothetical protein